MEDNQQHSLSMADNSENSIDFRRIISRLLSIWPWFILSICLSIGISVFYLRYQTPLYVINARLLVNDDKKGGMAENTELGDLGGIFGSKNSLENEVEVLKTRNLLRRVVLDMSLNIKYYREGKIRDHELYRSPFNIVFLKEADTIRTTKFTLKSLSNDKLSLKSENIDTLISYDKPIYLKNVGLFQIHNNGINSKSEQPFIFSITSVDSEVSSLRNNITVAPTNKLVTIIDFEMKHAIPRRGEDILNKLIEKYVQGNIEDKNKIADSTIKFIKNRLAYIGGELGDLEGNIQGFKERNNLVEMTEQSKILVQNTSQYVKELSQVETQINILNSLKEYLTDDRNNKRVLPSSTLLTDVVFNGLVERYNLLLLERDNKLISVTETNPQIVSLDRQIGELRVDMLSNLENIKRNLTISRAGLQKEMNTVEVDMQQVPQVERNYLDLARQQQIKQQLYLFLMQKNEETEISKTANLSNARIIDSPKSQTSPFSPKKQIVIFVGLIFGLLLPVSIVYVKELTNTRIDSRDDITRMTDVPILGEISHNDSKESLITASKSRSIISEQFRSLRTNLSFYLKGNDKTILLTSSMSGEGKSFIALNLGNILALTGKKVLIMELDLRKPGISQKLGLNNTYGFTNYVLNEDLISSEILQPLDIYPNLFLLSSGPIPPNPAETLMSDRMATLMEDLKKQFDYIIIDAPPIGLVTDAQLLSEYADLCLYIVRQKFTFKEQLNVIQGLNKSKKMRRLGVVMNDIGKSYGYGYGYGYGYSYGSYANEGEDSEVKESFFKKLLKRGS